MLLSAGSLVEEGLQWGVKLNNPEDLRAQRINKSLAAMLTLRSVCDPTHTPDGLSHVLEAVAQAVMQHLIQTRA